MIRSRLFHVMADRNIRSLAEVARRAGVAPRTLSVTVNSPSVRWDSCTLDALCRALDCQPGDLLEYIPDKPVVTLEEQKRQAVDKLAAKR